MRQFRCRSCKQLQFKYKLVGNRLEIEVKCYSCNHFSNFTIWLNHLKEDEKNNQHKQSSVNLPKVRSKNRTE